jgi:hypothetical protein
LPWVVVHRDRLTALGAVQAQLRLLAGALHQEFRRQNDLGIVVRDEPMPARVALSRRLISGQISMPRRR